MIVLLFDSKLRCPLEERSVHMDASGAVLRMQISIVITHLQMCLPQQFQTGKILNVVLCNSTPTCTLKCS